MADQETCSQIEQKLSSVWCLKGANKLKFIGECQLCIVQYVSVEKICTYELN